MSISLVSHFGFHVTLSFRAGLLNAVSNGDLNINVSTSHYLEIRNVDAMEHGGEYDCIVTNGTGIGRATAILYVEPYFTLQPVDVFANHGETATFTCMAESFPYPSYQWQKQQGSVFTDIYDETDTTLTINVTADSVGVCRCMVMTIIQGNTFAVHSREAMLYGELINRSEVCIFGFQIFRLSLNGS